MFDCPRATLSSFFFLVTLVTFASASAVATSPPAQAAPYKVVRKVHRALGTEVVAIAVAKDDEDARFAAAFIEAAFGEIDRVDELLDPSKGELGQVNASAGGAPVRLSPELFAVVVEAKRLAESTSGAFDPTFAALAPLWRFDANDPPAPQLAPSVDGGPAAEPFVAGTEKGNPSVPPMKTVAFARELVDASTLSLDIPAQTARLSEKGQRVSLGGIAKGYALGRAAEVLEEKGVGNFILAAGGDLVVRGKKGADAWTVGIQDPRALGHFAAFDAQPGAVMTSGDYERFFFADGKRMHHVLDPRSGFPARGLRSVTIVARDSVEADAFSTAVFVLGPKDGMALIERTEGVEGLLVTDKNAVLVSKGLKGKLRHRPPTDAP